MTEQQQKPIEMEWYCRMWTIRHSPLSAPNPLLNKDGEPMASWGSRELEFICSDRSGFGSLERIEEFVGSVGDTHYANVGFSYLHVYRLREGETLTEGNWNQLRRDKEGKWSKR